MSRREQVLDAVKALVSTALPNADVKRNLDRPASIPPGGMVVIRDGDPGEPETVLGPPLYSYEHKIELEIAGWPNGGSAAVDEMMTAIGAAVAANRTLGGLCDWLEPIAPFVDSSEQRGAPTVPWADAGLLAVYTTPSPL